MMNPPSAGSVARNRTESDVFELNGISNMPEIVLYRCPEGKRAWIETLFFRGSTTSVQMLLELMDPKYSESNPVESKILGQGIAGEKEGPIAP